MAAADDWFRSPRWDAACREDFEVRLRRARPTNRPQYLRIKALALETENPGAAEGLFERVIREYPDSTDAVFAVERVGDLQRSSGDLVQAEATYRSLLARKTGCHHRVPAAR